MRSARALGALTSGGLYIFSATNTRTLSRSLSSNLITTSSAATLPRPTRMSSWPPHAMPEDSERSMWEEEFWSPRRDSRMNLLCGSSASSRASVLTRLLRPPSSLSLRVRSFIPSGMPPLPTLRLPRLLLLPLLTPTPNTLPITFMSSSSLFFISLSISLCGRWIMGGSQVIISHITMPKLNTSLFKETLSWLRTSGAAQAGVPITPEADMPAAPPTLTHSPKSAILLSHSLFSKIFRLLRSLCACLPPSLLCKYLIPLATFFMTL
mmetsp:Transcript_3858/g.7300  ORF Transcript_3858/g.7300 Transcript_3858/m.7300 type:complete len:266 (+) Transcript_3858:373-1170(+)